MAERGRKWKYRSTIPVEGVDKTGGIVEAGPTLLLVAGPAVMVDTGAIVGSSCVGKVGGTTAKVTAT